jgi:hypothetical protein
VLLWNFTNVERRARFVTYFDAFFLEGNEKNSETPNDLDGLWNSKRKLITTES